MMPALTALARLVVATLVGFIAGYIVLIFYRIFVYGLLVGTAPELARPQGSPIYAVALGGAVGLMLAGLILVYDQFMLNEDTKRWLWLAAGVLAGSGVGFFLRYNNVAGASVALTVGDLNLFGPLPSAGDLPNPFWVLSQMGTVAVLLGPLFGLVQGLRWNRVAGRLSDDGERDTAFDDFLARRRAADDETPA